MYKSFLLSVLRNLSNTYNSSNRAFTLIELLVVVLIIGILASIAIPQYFKIIEKSRYMQAFHSVKALTDSYRRYVEIRGQIIGSTPSLDTVKANLDVNVDLTGDKHFTYGFQTNAVHHFIAFRNTNNAGYQYEIVGYSKWDAYPEYEFRVVCRETYYVKRRFCDQIGTNVHTYRYDVARQVSYLN